MRAFHPNLFLASILIICPWPGESAVVVDCTEAALRVALETGEPVTFGCSGTISLTSPLVIAGTALLDGTGRSVTVNAGGNNQIFQVQAGARLSLVNLTLTNGRGTNGGAVYNDGTFEAVGCTFTGNQAVGPFFTVGEGGAMWSSGVASLRECSFSNNSANGGQGFSMGGAGAPGWAGNGGAVCNRGSLVVSNCTFSGNRARGGTGGGGQTFSPGGGGSGQGGAIYNAQSAHLHRSTFDGNTSVGGIGGAGGLSTGGGSGGPGFGGAVYNLGTFTATNCTIHANLAIGGSGVFGRFFNGTNGLGFGGGVVQSGGLATFAFCTFAANTSTNGGGAIHGLSDAVTRLADSILAHTPGSPNGIGAIEDLGYNLSSDTSIVFSSPGSISGVDPKLGPLANNGGPTPTVALLLGSPAVDAGIISGALTTDQRGFPRPSGSQYDLGAFEGSVAPPNTTLLFVPNTTSVASTVALEISISNPNASGISHVRLTNSLSPNLSVDSGQIVLSGFDGIVLAAPGGQSIILTDFSLAAGASSLVRVPVRANVVGTGLAQASGLFSDQFGFQTLAVTGTLEISGGLTVAALPATDQGFTSATLHGQVNPGGAPTTAWFEYGTTPTMDQRTPTQVVPAGFAVVPLDAALTALPSSTDFYFRVAASNQFGVLRSAPGTFFTLGNVTVADETHLRANLVRGGSIPIVTDGTITLSNTILITTDTEIDATGHQVTLSGGDDVRVIEIAEGASLILRNVTIAHGHSTNGAGIYNAGSLQLEHCIVTENQAVGAGGETGRNGASAPPHPPAPQGPGEPGSPGSIGGSGLGGALYNRGTASAINSTISNNRAAGGIGGAGGAAGLPNVAAVYNTPGGVGGIGGTAKGGGIFNAGAGTLTLNRCTISGNYATGGTGGIGGRNEGPSNNIGGPGGDALGAGIRSEGSLNLINITVADNEASGGAGGGAIGLPPANGGNAAGGGISAGNLVHATNCTIASNRAIGGPRAVWSNSFSVNLASNGVAYGAGLLTTGTVAVLKNTLLAQAPSHANCFGPLIDAGDNLSSDYSCPFTSASSRSGIDPRIAPLADNGGTTLTMALLPSSPAIDAGDASDCPPTDQRGQPRPALAGCDIGAYETQPDSFGIRSIERISATTVRLTGFGLPSAAFRVLTSPDLGSWAPGASGVVAPDGRFELQVNTAVAGQVNFFRTVSP